MEATSADIWWVGDSDWLPYTRRDPASCRLAMPLVEESVLDVAFDSPDHLLRLSTDAALNCVSRHRLRLALQPTGLNPPWRPLEWPVGGCAVVVKAPCSSFSRGVQVVNGAPAQLDALARRSPGERHTGVVEAYIEGPQYEVDGYVLSGKVTTFYPVRQVWHGAAIHRYERVSDPGGLCRAAERAVLAVGLDWCPFCVEMRLSPSGWRVIEVNARLGEDPQLGKAIADGDPLSEIERAAFAAVAAR